MAHATNPQPRNLSNRSFAKKASSARTTINDPSNKKFPAFAKKLACLLSSEKEEVHRITARALLMASLSGENLSEAEPALLAFSSNPKVSAALAMHYSNQGKTDKILEMLVSGDSCRTEGALMALRHFPEPEALRIMSLYLEKISALIPK